MQPDRSGLVRRDADSDLSAIRHRKPVWNLSWGFFLFFLFFFLRSKLLSSFRTSPVQKSAQLFPPQLIWNSNRCTVSLRSMKHVAILSKLSSNFGKKDKQKHKKKIKNKNQHLIIIECVFVVHLCQSFPSRLQSIKFLENQNHSWVENWLWGVVMAKHWGD